MKNVAITLSPEQGLSCVSEIIRETEKAILISDGAYEAWLPKSQLKINQDYIEVPDWLWMKNFHECLAMSLNQAIELAKEYNEDK
ncbi:MAG: hypothetical protein KKD18_07295 [Nanoarchaeota archaeon]|nr:hypothetical protein [Nanoarchaeota archaeon]